MSRRNLIITITEGAGVGRRFIVEPDHRLSFGRTAKSDTVIEDNFMSGKHFGVEHFGEYAEVQDYGSKNKTMVNRQPVDQHRLNPGDIIRAGKTEFLVSWDEPLPVPTDSAWNDDNQARHLRPSTPEVHPQPLFEQSNLSPISDSSRYIPPIRPLKEQALSNVNQAKPINPFESSDLPPVDYSRLDVKLSSQRSPIAVSSSAPIPSSGRMMRLSLTLRGGIQEIIEKLGRQPHIHAQVVAHFRKIGVGLPDRLTATPLFQSIPDKGDFLPVIVSTNDWLDRIDATIAHRLSINDGLIIVLLERNVMNETAALQELTTRGVPNFSEESGFLGWCWPSQFLPMCQSMNPETLARFMGTWISGFICPARDRQVIVFARDSLESVLKEMGFE